MPHCKRILVGTMADQKVYRDAVSSDEAMNFAKENKFLAYFEVCNTRSLGIDDDLRSFIGRARYVETKERRIFFILRVF